MEIIEFGLTEEVEATPLEVPPTLMEQFLATIKCWQWAAMHSPKFSDCYLGFDRTPVEGMFLKSSTNSFTSIAITFYHQPPAFRFPSLVIDHYQVSNPQANTDLIWR